MTFLVQTQKQRRHTLLWKAELGFLLAVALFFAYSGQVMAQRPGGGSGDASQLIDALSSGDVYVVNGLKNDVDESALQAAVQRAKPTVVKIVAVAKTGSYPSRAALADDLRKRLALSDDAVVIVGTPKGVSASSARLSPAQLDDTFKNARLDTAFASGGLTGALVKATESVSGTVVSDRKSETGRGGLVIFGGLAAVGGYIAFASHKKKKALADVQAPLLPLRKQALENLSYVDGYLDVLPPSADADRARQLRASAYEAYSTANGIMKTSQKPAEISQAGPLLQQSVGQLLECRNLIDKATGGTGVVLGLPSDMPSLQTDEQKGRDYLAQSNLRPVEALQTADERDRMQAEINQIPADQRGVSFFSGRPLPASDLIPVNIVVQGQKRTVMASREEAESIRRGQTPQVRAFPGDNGQYVPWYEHRNYDPYRDYYGGWGYSSGVGSFVDLYLLSNLLGGGMFGGYGPWGWGGWGWGMAQPPLLMGNTYYGPSYGAYGDGGGGYYDNSGNYGNDGNVFSGGGDSGIAAPDNTGGMDFFGQGGYNEQGGSDNGGGFDFGSGDTGSDSGGGGFDFGGGGDSGGGFDGGGGDGGGGGGD